MTKSKRQTRKAETASTESTDSSSSRASSQLSSVIKSARDIMRKDKGLNGDLDRLPMLTWAMFLKFLDDAEKNRELECQMSGKTYSPIIEAPYRWRDWAGSIEGPRGDDLTAFINQDELTLQNGKRGPGLFAYLRNLHGTEQRDRRDVVATVFRETNNRMQSGSLLRDLLEVIDRLDFSSSRQVHAIGRVYEIMLRELRDAAGDSGEFYTPRPVIRMIVEVLKPRIGEIILDPACGTGGFLVESFEYLSRQCKKADDMTRLQDSLQGVEAKSLPYLLCQMNMILHGIDSPNVVMDNSLIHPLREIGDKDRVDLIMTNPPFGGEEERAVLRNFPADMQTTDTAYLFLQLVMRKLKRRSAASAGGRCAIIVPDGVLFSTGVGSRVRKQLLDDFNLTTILKLPHGVFAPYTDITTNILFFESGGPTKEIWFYEHPLPAASKSYTKTRPIRFEEFAPFIDWWNRRIENEHSWAVSREKISPDNYLLDLRRQKDEKVSFDSPEDLLNGLLHVVDEIRSLLLELDRELSSGQK